MQWLKKHPYILLLLYAGLALLILSPSGHWPDVAAYSVIAALVLGGILVWVYAMRVKQKRNWQSRDGDRPPMYYQGTNAQSRGSYPTTTCVNHSFREAFRFCESCGKSICISCENRIDGKTYCPDCAAKLKAG